MSGIFGCVGEKVQGMSDVTRLVKWNRLYGMSETEIMETGRFLGCCHEKITDHAKKEKPLIKRNDRLYVLDVILFNREELLGRIYEAAKNSRTEETKDKAALVSEESDEELLTDYIEAFGVGAVADVNGEFAGAVYDEGKKQITLFRDHMGVRPLFYYESEGLLAFSTDIRGLLGLEAAQIRISEEWLSKLVKGYGVTSDIDTEYEGVYCVRQASFRSYHVDTKVSLISEESYWFPGCNKTRCRSEEEYQKVLRCLVEDAIQRRVSVTSKKVGGELSGGLDSSVIDIIINRLGREGMYYSWSKDPKVLPLVEQDERATIEDICKQEGIECLYTDSVEIGEDSLVAARMREAGLEPAEDENMELKFGLPAYANAEYIMLGGQRLKQQGIDIIFSGHTGDEGVSHRPNIYELFYHHEYYHYLRNMWRRSKTSRHRILSTLRMIKKNLFVTGPGFHKPYEEIFGMPELLTKEFANKLQNEKRVPFYFCYDIKQYILSGGSRVRLDNHALQGACCGVRYFVPYADYRLIDFAVSIPRHLYIRGNTGRYIFREAFKDIMPKSLYRLSVKSENSRKAEKVPEDYSERYKRNQRELVGHLSKEEWGAYLSFEKIREWIETDHMDKVERGLSNDMRMLYLLTRCAKAQNALDVARKTKP